MLPNLLIAGAPRCGTTSLFHYLQLHPEISFPKLKEPRYFSSYRLSLPQHGPGDHSVDQKLVTDYETYIRLYDQLHNTYVGDGSTTYLYHYRDSIPEIKRRLGQPHIILVLRQPVQRAYSAYYNLVRDGRETETFSRAIALENARIAEGYDMMWHLTAVSMYADSVEAYLQAFSNVEVILYDDLREDSLAILNGISTFLGISPFPGLKQPYHYSKGGIPRFKHTTSLVGRKNGASSKLRQIIENVLGRHTFEMIGRIMLKPHPDLSEIDFRNLLPIFIENIKRLEKILNRDLSKWAEYE